MNKLKRAYEQFILKSRMLWLKLMLYGNGNILFKPFWLFFGRSLIQFMIMIIIPQYFVLLSSFFFGGLSFFPLAGIFVIWLYLYKIGIWDKKLRTDAQKEDFDLAQEVGYIDMDIEYFAKIKGEDTKDLLVEFLLKNQKIAPETLIRLEQILPQHKEYIRSHKRYKTPAQLIKESINGSKND